MAKADSNAPARKTSEAPKKEGGKGAPRARKFNYGITDEAKIVMAKKDEEIGTLKGDLTGDYTALGKAKTVAQYKENGGTRHGLRVFMRRGILQLTHGGETYPQDYVKPEPKPKAEKKPKAAAG